MQAVAAGVAVQHIGRRRRIGDHNNDAYEVALEHGVEPSPDVLSERAMLGRHKPEQAATDPLAAHQEIEQQHEREEKPKKSCRAPGREFEQRATLADPIARANHRRVNDVIRGLAARAGGLADIHAHFLTGDPSWYTRTIEPSLLGASEIRRVFLAVL